MIRYFATVRRFTTVLVCISAVTAFAARAEAGEPASEFDPEEISALAEKLGLSDTQKRAIRKIHDDARKSEVKLQAEIEVHSIDLRRELEQPDPNEKTVAVLIEKIARLEGEVRKTRILASLAVRKVLSAEQRKKMEAFRGQWRHRHLDIERHAMDVARSAMEQKNRQLEVELREIEARAREFEAQARKLDERAANESHAQKRDLERAARELREHARELERAQREMERAQREMQKERQLAEERAREKERQKRGKGTAKLQIQAKQPAEIYLDGERIGTTPLVSELRAGKYQLEARWKDGKVKRVVVVKPGKDIKLVLEGPKK